MKTKTLHIKVTKKDISKGIPMEANLCPIAHAINRHPLVLEDTVEVCNSSICFKTKSGYSFDIETPKFVQKFIKKFDEKASVGLPDSSQTNVKKFKPFAFDIVNIEV